MANVEVSFRAWLRWWAIPMLHAAVLLRSARLVRFVRDHGVRVELA